MTNLGGISNKLRRILGFRVNRSTVHQNTTIIATRACFFTKVITPIARKECFCVWVKTERRVWRVQNVKMQFLSEIPSD